MIRDITSLVLSRPHKQCNFIEFKEKKIVYKRWAYPRSHFSHRGGLTDSR
jgi:hypothetical protein